MNDPCKSQGGAKLFTRVGQTVPFVFSKKALHTCRQIVAALTIDAVVVPSNTVLLKQQTYNCLLSLPCYKTS